MDPEAAKTMIDLTEAIRELVVESRRRDEIHEDHDRRSTAAVRQLEGRIVDLEQRPTQGDARPTIVRVDGTRPVREIRIVYLDGTEDAHASPG